MRVPECCATFKAEMSRILVVLLCIVSIVMSVIQSQSSKRKILASTWKEEFCDKWPMMYLRPFTLLVYDDVAKIGEGYYCGYGQIETGLRIGLASLNLIFHGYCMLFPADYGRIITPLMNKRLLSILVVLWWSVFVVDSFAVGNGELACEDNLFDMCDRQVNGKDVCDCTVIIYGVSICLDIVGFIFTLYHGYCAAGVHNQKEKGTTKGGYSNPPQLELTAI